MSTLPSRIDIIEVGPREGFQYEGIFRPDSITVAEKLRLIDALGKTGVKTIQIASFVHPKIVPQSTHFIVEFRLHSPPNTNSNCNDI